MRQMMRIVSIGVAVLVLAACAGAPATNQATTQTTTVRRGNLAVAVSSSGTVQPLQSANLSFGVNGTVEKVFVSEGQAVSVGQELASIDTRDLDQQVLQSEANLQTAQARLEQAKSGNATEQDKAAADAQVRNAQAGLQRARTGNATAADIASAQAQVRNAQAGLQRARTGNVTEADIANAEAAVRLAQANYDAATRGAQPDQVSTAQTRLTQAQQSLQKTAAAASANKTTAEQSMNQTADAVRQAQESYTTAYWNNDQAQRGIDPATNKRFADEKLDEDVQKRQYADALRSAELQLSQAQSKLEQAKVAFENAKQQEINDVASAQAQVDDAQTQLNELLKGPQSTDVAKAQAQLDQAKAQLQKLTQGGSTADIAAARAQLDQANAQLQKLRQGGTAADIAAAQAQIDQSQAQLEKLSAGSAPSDISIAQAGVSQAESQLNAAKLNRDKAILRAPFDGIITAVNVSVGDSSAGAGASAAASGGGAGAFTIVDPSKLHLNVNVSENDVAQVKNGQAAQVTIDALGTEVITGTVSYIAPSATTLQNVTTYRVQVELPQNNKAIRVGMNASVEIRTSEKQNVLIVPASAIRSEGSQRFVRIKQGDKFEDREIKIGTSNDVEVEVISGLKEGDVIATIGTATTTR